MSAYDEAVAAIAGGADPHDAAAALVAEMTPEERLWCLDGDFPCWAGLGDLGTGGYHKRPFVAAVVERVGMPGFAFSDGPRGVVVDRATAFPVSMARGATWDVELEERIGDAIGLELRAIGASLYGGVCVNVLRHPAWGRAQETYGEDPCAVGEMGAALTRGVQRHAMACVKHFACNSMENARFKVDVSVDEQALHEVYLPHFKRIVDEGVACVMSAYNSVNGAWCGESHALLTDVLRDEWGFDGFVISDWIFGLRDAVRSLSAGLDVEMPYRMIRAPRLPGALADGSASWDDVDRSVAHVVATRLRFDAVLSSPAPGRDVLACPEHRALAREAAAKATVLLRNESVDGAPVLPIDPGPVRRVAVVGELASSVNLGDAGSSDVWVPSAVTVLDGLRSALPDADVVFDDGSDMARAATVAGDADVALVVAGYTFADEGEFIGGTGSPELTSLFPAADEPEVVERFNEFVATGPEVETPDHVRDRAASGGGFATGGDRSSLRLPDRQVALIRAVAGANPRTVVVLVGGSAVVVAEWVDSVPAVVQAWYGGMEAGNGLADVLLGTVDATGRLPFSVPADESHLPAFDRDASSVVYDRWHGWWHLEREGHTPQFPFGFGLSYTTFSLADLVAAFADGHVRVGVTVANTGDRDSTDVVQVYAHRAGSDDPRRLIGFARVPVPAGRSVVVPIAIPADRLAVRDTTAHAMVVRPGAYDITVARHAADPAALRATVDVTP